MKGKKRTYPRYFVNTGVCEWRDVIYVVFTKNGQDAKYFKKNGSTGESCSIEQCEKFVTLGYWKEVPASELVLIL